MSWLRREAFTLGLALSIGAHLAVARTLPDAPQAPTPRPRPELIRIDPKPPPPKPKRTNEAPAAVATATELEPNAPAASPARAVVKTTEGPASEPVALAGVTLSGGDTGWESALGNGQPIVGPIGTGMGNTRTDAPRPSGRVAPTSAPPPAPAPPSDVPLQDLSEKPRAPHLNGSLARLYPAAAREQQITGQAAVRVRVGPSGAVSATQLQSESFPGFGAACQAALRGSQFSSPRDKQGRAVSTWLLYRCNFQLRR